MSATLDIELLLDYFDIIPSNINVGIVEDRGKVKLSYDITKYYKTDGNTISERLISTLKDIDKLYVKNKIVDEPFRNILIFTTGGLDMNEIL